MTLRLGDGHDADGWLPSLIRRFSTSRFGGHGPDLRVRVVVRATPLARATTPRPEADPAEASGWEGWRSSSHPEAGRLGGAAGGPPLPDPDLDPDAPRAER